MKTTLERWLYTHTCHGETNTFDWVNFWAQEEIITR